MRLKVIDGRLADWSAGDESKPTCEGCQSRSERCEWGVKVSFRPGMNVCFFPVSSTASTKHDILRALLLERSQVTLHHLLAVLTFR